MFFVRLFIFRGHSTREPAFSRVTYFILRVSTPMNTSEFTHARDPSSTALIQRKSWFVHLHVVNYLSVNWFCHWETLLIVVSLLVCAFAVWVYFCHCMCMLNVIWSFLTRLNTMQEKSNWRQVLPFHSSFWFIAVARTKTSVTVWGNFALCFVFPN